MTRLAMFILAAAQLSACAMNDTARMPTADAMHTPLTDIPGDATRGRIITIAREGGHCILCHYLPADDVKFFGNVAPPLTGVGSRLNAAQLRQRVVDISAVNPQAVMPAFHRLTNLQRVAGEYRDKPVLDAQQVEDVVAYLVTLKN